MLIDARQQFEKEPKAFGNKRNRMSDVHRQWIEIRYQKGWKVDKKVDDNVAGAKAASDPHVKLFKAKDFAFHKVKVVFWQTDEHDQPATVTEPYEKSLTSANLKKEQEFYDSDISFSLRVKADGKAKTVIVDLKPADSATKKLKAALGENVGDWPEIVSVQWTHRHYVADDEYIPHGEDIAAFLTREIAKPIIRWEDSPQLGYEILPNKYFYRYQPPTPAKDLLAKFWVLEKEAEKMLEGLAGTTS
jgi:type I restriction enzyme M protein